MKKIAQETKKPNNRIALEKQIREGVLEMWSNFNKSDADRQLVLAIFDEAKEKFANKPRIIEFFENLKIGFLKSEVENEKISWN
jgi:hypothetical protein